MQQAGNSGAQTALKIELERNETHRQDPLDLSGALESFEFEESTPAIGREYVNIDVVKDILEADNADELIRDLAITGKYAQRNTASFWLLTSDTKQSLEEVSSSSALRIT